MGIFNKKEKTNLLVNILIKKVDQLSFMLQKSNIDKIMDILGSRKEIMKRNIIAGIFRGIGLGIGFTIMTAILIIILQKIVTLNIPVIGEFISDIVDIVENSR